MAVDAAGTLRIAILTSHPVPYHVAFYRELARRQGVELEVLYTHDHGVKPTFDAGFGREVKFDVPLLEGYRYKFLRNYARTPGFGFFGQVNPDVLRDVTGDAYDAIVVHGYQFLTYVATLLLPRPLRRRTKLLLRSESNHLHERSSGLRVAKEGVIRGLYANVDHFLAIGSKSAEYFESYGVPRSRISIAAYTVDNALFFERSAEARREPGAVRRGLGLPDDRPLFLYCSKVVPHKRPLDVVRAFAIARAAAPCALAIVGDGAQLPEVECEIARLDLGADVHVLGFRNQSELPSIYGASDVFIQASEREPWGMVVNEAMACGAAICASDRIGSAYDLVRDNGAMFPVGDVRRLGAILSEWARTPSVLFSMKEASLRRIAHWSVTQTADGVIEGVRAAVRR